LRRVYDAATGEEPSPEPYETPDRDSLRLGGSFGTLAVQKSGRQLSAHAIPGWRRVWEVDTEDPDTGRPSFIAAKGVVLMRSDTTTTRLGGSFVSESRIAAFDLDTGAFLWRYVGDEVRSVTAIRELAIGVGNDRVLAVPLRGQPSRRWWQL
jgi:hypothetical protein